MKHYRLYLALLAFIVGTICFWSGCSVISYDRAFPTVTWAWTKEAKIQRAENRRREQAVKAYQKSLTKTNL